MDLADIEILKKLQDMDEYEFEDLVADLWEKQGWDTTVTPDSNDGGVDVIAEKDTPFHQKEIIQVKRHSSDSTVGSPAIQRINSVKDQREGVDTVVVVTTNEFSLPAQDAASNLNVKTINGKQLVALVDDLEAGGIINKYVKIKESGEIKHTRSDQKDTKQFVKKLNECIRLSKNTSERVHSILYLDGSRAGYSIIPLSFGDGFYNVHGFMNELNTIDRFDKNDWKMIQKVSNKNNLQVIGRDNKGGGQMFVGRPSGGNIPEVDEIKSTMFDFLSSVFSVSPQTRIYIKNRKY